MALEVGSLAPDFELPLEPGEAPVRLADYRGEKTVVLLFFPLAFSSVCTDEVCSVAENYAEWTELEAEVIGISVDSPFVTKRFAKECGATFPILSDFNKTATSDYGVRNDDFFGMKGVANRSAFVVNRAGKIVYTWESTDPSTLPPLDEIRGVVVDLSEG